MSNSPFTFDTSETLPWCLLASSSEGICLVEAASGRVAWHNRTFAEACRHGTELTEMAIQTLFPNWPKLDGCDTKFGRNWRLRITSGEGWYCIYVRQTETQRSIDRRDPLTGIADRSQFERQMQLAWNEVSFGFHLALVFIDLNRFKRINDTLGHLTGDQALRQIAERLKSAFRSDDFLARYGGDEFVALLAGIEKIDALSQIVQRIHNCLSEPIRIESHEFVVSASVGIASSIDRYSSPEEMIRAADRAMYASKQSHRTSD